MTWDERLAECKARIQESEVPEWQAKPWPWQELEHLADVLSAQLEAGVAKIMRDAGESGEQLAAIRRSQVAYSIQARNGLRQVPKS